MIDEDLQKINDNELIMLYNDNDELDCPQSTYICSSMNVEMLCVLHWHTVCLKPIFLKGGC